MKKILFVTFSASPYQIELFDYINSLKLISIKVIYLNKITPNRFWKERKIRHEHSFELSRKISSELSTWESNADLLVVTYYNNPIALKLINIRIARKMPLVLWGERPGFSYPFLGKIYRNWVLKKFHKSKKPIWGIGNFGVSGFKKEFGLDRKYFNIPYYSNLQRFSDQLKCSNSNSQRIILFSGSLIKRKGVDLVAKAFLNVAQRHHNISLHILGVGPLKDYLETTLSCLIDRVKFYGFKDWDDLPGIYSKADILCVPSRYDGWGLVVPEGLASGLPVICTNRMGSQELISNDYNGWILPANSQMAIEHAIERIATMSDEILKELASNAKASIREHSLHNGAFKIIDTCLENISNNILI